MKIKGIDKAIKQAGKDTAKLMTTQLRNEAMSSGWDETTAKALSVKYENNEFKYKYPKAKQNDVDALEYGTESSQPNAVMRRFSNHSVQEAESFLMGRLKQLTENF